MPHPPVNWDERYLEKNTPWDSGRASLELQRVLDEGWFEPGRMLELGCGTGTNALFLASQGFEVTAVDISRRAVDHARARAAKAGANIRFEVADVLDLPDLGERYPLVFDRGVYHHLREVDLDRFLRTLERVTAPGGHYLTLAGNANEVGMQNGPPRVHAHHICLELGQFFDLVQLREFRFDGVVIEGQELRPLAWSALLRRKSAR